MKIMYRLGATKSIGKIRTILFCRYYELIKGLPYTGNNREEALRTLRRWICMVDVGPSFLFLGDEEQADLGRTAAGDSIRKEIEDLARQVKNETEDYAS